MKTLDRSGTAILRLLLKHIHKVKIGDPRTYLGYKEVHDLLGLKQVRTKWGESLKCQGLSNLADWTADNNLPAITGLIISTDTLEPGQGYFDLFGKAYTDYKWWENEITKPKDFNWSRHIYQNNDSMEKPESNQANKNSIKAQTSPNKTLVDSKLNTYLIKLGRDSVPGNIVAPKAVNDWKGIFSCNGRKNTVFPDNTAAPDPKDGDKVYVWVHEDRINRGQGLTAKAVIKNPLRDGTKFKFELSNLELQTNSFPLIATKGQDDLISAMHHFRKNCIWCLNDNHISELTSALITAKDAQLRHSRELDYNPDKDISLIGLDITEKDTIIKSRRGQGMFRDALFDYWNSCAVTDLDIESLLRASHIKAWKDSNNHERLDTFNGLLLNPTLDLAFDKHIISFDKHGHILISNDLNSEDRQKLGISPTMKLQKYEPRHEQYMAIHRAEFIKREAKLLP